MPLCASDISPGCGMPPPPTNATSLLCGVTCPYRGTHRGIVTDHTVFTISVDFYILTVDSKAVIKNFFGYIRK
jgi:hypothetical protein